ncbi:MAG: hypothetical protein WCP15_02520 [bacterium]
MKKILISISAFLLPVVTFAQTGGTGGTGGTVSTVSGVISNGDDVVKRIVSIFNIAIYILISFAVLYLVWMIVKYFIAGDSESKGEVATRIGFGILGLFIILSIWGLVNILTSTFKAGDNTVDTSRFPKAIQP